MELIVRIAQLNREGVFIDSGAAHFTAVAGDNANGKKFIEVSRGNLLNSPRERGGGIEYCLTQVVWTALRTNTCELRTNRAALAVDDVAGRATRFLIRRAPLFRVSGWSRRRRAAERSHVCHELCLF